MQWGLSSIGGEILKPDVFTENPVRANFSAAFEKTLCFDGKNLMQISDKNFQFYRYQLSFQILNIGISDFFIIITMKGLDTVESLSAGEARDSNRNMGTLIIIYIFVTFTHSNIDFHKLLMKISGTLHSSLSCYIPRYTYWVRVCRFFTSLNTTHLEHGGCDCRVSLIIKLCCFFHFFWLTSLVLELEFWNLEL